MDHEQRTQAAERFDPKNAARIVRQIAAIERDHAMAAENLSTRLMKDSFTVIGNAAPAPWITAETEYSVSLMSPEWKMSRGVGGRGDAWFELAEIGEDDIEHTWIGAAVGAGKTRLGLELTFRKGLQPQAIAAIADSGKSAALVKLGFRIDEAKERIYLPLEIPGELLAQGFEQGDLAAKTLLPLHKAVETVLTGKAQVDAFIEAVRAAAKVK